ncbi:MAG: hypothetical protein HY855_17135 [Burkholderiales bacterium]|nr:hypothetical protein [Burkholderiales bacterium]
MQVHLLAPESRAGSATPVAMAVQIGENRHARLDITAGQGRIDLGRIEKGWTTFRISDLRWAAPAAGPPVGRPDALTVGSATGSCSGGFEAGHSRTYRIVVAVAAGRLHCEIR